MGAVPPSFAKLLERPKDEKHAARKHATAYKVLAVLALIALILQTSVVLLSLFEEPLAYRIVGAGAESIDSPAFVRLLSAVSFGGFYPNNRVDVFTNGEAFYAPELSAIRAAKRSVHIECYIFQEGRLTDQFIRALEERAAAGVEVRLVIDALGSASFPKARFERLEQAGARVAWYHPVRWFTWPRANNRTHRELIVVDGTVGFLGGAGFDDQWIYGSDGDPRWRDTMVRLEGEGATGLAASFAENWLESSGEVLANPDQFPFHSGPGRTDAVVVTSSPTTGRSTEARILFQILIAKAARSIRITTPYFLPDKSLRGELVRAIRERGVEVTILVPGAKSDHLLTRRSSRSLYGDLLLAGARVYEYQPAMIHAKILIVDGVWSVVGSTNLDSRSFGLNDEVNVAIPDRAVAARLAQDFEQDIARSLPVSYEQWKGRPILEKITERLGWLLFNQQ
jgi:cardiolipin synthase